jgi:hypothetical protein
MSLRRWGERIAILWNVEHGSEDTLLDLALEAAWRTVFLSTN